MLKKDILHELKEIAQIEMMIKAKQDKLIIRINSIIDYLYDEISKKEEW